MRMKGGGIIIGPIVITMGLYFLSKPSIGVILADLLVSASQILALTGTTLLAISFVMGSRARFLENWFGGLDKITRIHHTVGGLAFVMLIHHPLLLAISVLPNVDLAVSYFYLSGEKSYNWGIIALWVMIMALILTFIVKLPYNIWLKTHDFLGLTLLLAWQHIFSIGSDISRYPLLKAWIGLMLAGAIYSYIYKVFLYRRFGPKYGYVVDKIQQLGQIVEIYLNPESSRLSFKPGQFAFVNFEKTDLKEPHPLSFSSSPDNGVIRLSIKMVGNYTLTLKSLQPGTRAWMWGSYGRLGEGFGENKDVVCLAGGIGITPFLSLIAYETEHQRKRNIYLFYSVKSRDEAVYNKELLGFRRSLTNFHYFPHFSNKESRLTANIVEQKIGELKAKRFYLCGPAGMMTDLSVELKKMGVKSSDIIFENFSFKE